MSESKEFSDTALERLRATAQAASDRLKGNVGHQGLPFEVYPEQAKEARNSVKKILALDVKHSVRSRTQIADELSQAAGRKITLFQIDAWASMTHNNQFPTYLIPFWVLDTGSSRLLEFLCAGAGLYLADQRTFDLAELAKAMLQAERLEQQQRDLKIRLTDRVL